MALVDKASAAQVSAVEGATSLRRRSHTTPTASGPADNEHDEQKHDGEPAQKEGVLGKTADGTVFKIPQTHNMISSLFDPRLPKSNIDLLTLFLLGSQLVLFVMLPRSIARWFFGLYFAFWRLAYDAGLGYVLRQQSEKRWIVRTIAREGWFDSARKPATAKWVRSELDKKMGKDYKFTDVPLEFNVWILFRHSVDVILLNDFLSYVLFSLSFFHFAGPPGHSVLFHLSRWTAGVILLLFNLWVKTDAHKIVKDYAWYWGDAFFLSLQNLVFDGVFELAPHPMYSVGYAGYYGLSLIVASPLVLLVSVMAHAAQFGFLVYFENPHIERTYGQRKPLSARMMPAPGAAPRSDGQAAARAEQPQPTRLDLDNKYFYKELIVLKNWDGFRARDLAYVLVTAYAFLPVVFPSISVRAQMIVLSLHALCWRVFHSGVLGWALKLQGERRWLVRHMIKHYHYENEGEAVLDTFTQWKSTYSLSLSMTYISFASLAWKCYSVPHDWTVGSELVRHILGLILVSLHVWTARSTFDVLGPFGWFYGDFFIDDYPHELVWTGIFRYLNNPERSMGGAAFFGLALLSGSKLVLIQAIFAVLAHWWFLSCVENPHMQRLYGNALRKDAGLTKTLRNAVRRVSFSHKDQAAQGGDILRRLSKNAREVQGSVEKVLEETADAVEEFLKKSAPAVKGYVEETKILLQRSGERLVISRVANDLASYDPSSYSLQIRPSTFPPPIPHASSSTAPSLRFHLGEPIVVSWAAPLNHSRKDWVGLYRFGANSDTLVTKISSQGKWLGVCDEWEGDHFAGQDGELAKAEPAAQDAGDLLFSSKRLPWRAGKYEFRYHHQGKHNCMAISEPFEVFVEKPANPDDAPNVKETLLNIVAKTLALDPAVVPASASSLVQEARSMASSRLLPSGTQQVVDGKGKGKASTTEAQEHGGAQALSDIDDFILYSSDEAEHIAYAIQVAFDVELDKEVVLAAANVGKLASRVTEARRLLRPGSPGTGMKADLKEE